MKTCVHKRDIPDLPLMNSYIDEVRWYPRPHLSPLPNAINSGRTGPTHLHRRIKAQSEMWYLSSSCHKILMTTDKDVEDRKTGLGEPDREDCKRERERC